MDAQGGSSEPRAFLGSSFASTRSLLWTGPAVLARTVGCSCEIQGLQSSVSIINCFTADCSDRNTDPWFLCIRLELLSPKTPDVHLLLHPEHQLSPWMGSPVTALPPLQPQVQNIIFIHFGPLNCHRCCRSHSEVGRILAFQSSFFTLTTHTQGTPSGPYPHLTAHGGAVAAASVPSVFLPRLPQATNPANSMCSLNITLTAQQARESAISSHLF